MPFVPENTRFSFTWLWTFATFCGFLLSLLLIALKVTRKIPFFSQRSLCLTH